MVKKKQARPGDKGFYLNEDEAIAYAGVCWSLSAILIILLLTCSLLINLWFFVGVTCMVFFYTTASFFANYLKFNDLIKKRDENGERKTKKRRKTTHRTIKR